MRENGRFIAVDGPIGVGKTAIAEKIAELLGGTAVLDEADDNPFLEQFFFDPRRYAFSTQTAFLLNRYAQHRNLMNQVLRAQEPTAFVSDYVFAKDRIFAYLNLEKDELALYEHLSGYLDADIPTPDVVVFLQMSAPKILDRLKKRKHPYDKHLSTAFVQELAECYQTFFFHYDNSPLLIVNMDDVNPDKHEKFLSDLMIEIERTTEGKRYYIPNTSRKR